MSSEATLLATANEKGLVYVSAFSLAVAISVAPVKAEPLSVYSGW